MKTGLKIVAIYLFGGIIWILLSDTLLESMSMMSAEIQIWKGIGYVIVTSIILYFLLKYNFDELNKKVRELKEKSKTEQELRNQLKQEKKSISALINSTEDFIWSVDDSYRLIVANNAFINRAKRYYGLDFGVDKSMFPSSLSEDVVAKWKEIYDRGFAGETFKFEEEFFYPIPDLKEYIEVSIHPIYDMNDQIVGVSCMGNDISDRKENEILIEQKNNKLMEIAWYQSHELRTPLSRIMGLVYLIELEYPISDEHKEILQHIKDASEELDGIIRKVVKLTENLEEVENTSNR